jgi:hypothetical protein
MDDDEDKDDGDNETGRSESMRSLFVCLYLPPAQRD